MKSSDASLSMKGYLCVAAAAVMWASSGTAGKALFTGGVTPFELVQIRVTVSAVLLSIVFGIWFRPLFRIRPRDLWYFFLLGGVVMALVQVTYFYAISKIQVAAAIFIQYLAPVMVAFFSICFWQERLTPRQIRRIAPVPCGMLPCRGGLQPPTAQNEPAWNPGGSLIGPVFCGIYPRRRKRHAPLFPLDRPFLLFPLCNDHLAHVISPIPLSQRPLHGRPVGMDLLCIHSGNGSAFRPLFRGRKLRSFHTGIHYSHPGADLSRPVCLPFFRGIAPPPADCRRGHGGGGHCGAPDEERTGCTIPGKHQKSKENILMFPEHLVREKRRFHIHGDAVAVHQPFDQPFGLQ